MKHRLTLNDLKKALDPSVSMTSEKLNTLNQMKQNKEANDAIQKSIKATGIDPRMPSFGKKETK